MQTVGELRPADADMVCQLLLREAVALLQMSGLERHRRRHVTPVPVTESLYRFPLGEDEDLAGQA